MFRSRFLLVSSLAFTLITLACNLSSGSAGQNTAQIIEVTATPVIPPTVAGDATTSAAEALPATEAPYVTPSTPATLPPDCTLDSDFVADVTIPDRTAIKIGTTFEKTWRLRNSGTCPWNGGFEFVQIEGNVLMATPHTVLLPNVSPGDEIDISMTLTLSSAAAAGSEQTARFQVRAPDKRLFGTKPFVKILAVSSGGSGGAGIDGTVWADHCSVASNMPSVGCISASGGGYLADGLWNHGELTIGGVLVSLRSGTCSGSVIATDTTIPSGPSDGIYGFPNLAAGTYCVSIDSLDTTNVDILIPGGWTYPAGMFDKAEATVIVTVNAGQYVSDANFGWDYQLD